MRPKVIQRDIEDIVSEFHEDLLKLNGKTVLVTGANGMIPSYLVDVLAESNKVLGTNTQLKLYNKNKTEKSSRLGYLLGENNIEFIKQDVGKTFNIKGKIDIILHAASRANPISFKKEPIDTIDANVNGTRTLLNYSIKNPIEQFLFFSSSEVYGNPPENQIPTPETYPGNVNQIGDMACYAESKRFSETLCTSFFRQYNTPIKLLRIFQTYGPGLRNDGKTIANMFNNGLNEGRITLRDPGTSRRSLSYISDTTRGILQVMFKGNFGEAYNIGNDENFISMRELAEKIKKNLKISTEVEYPKNYNHNQERIQNRMPNIYKLRELGFSPKVNLDEGLKRLKEYYIEKGVN